jgi:hypothetical protein
MLELASLVSGAKRLRVVVLAGVWANMLETTSGGALGHVEGGLGVCPEKRYDFSASDLSFDESCSRLVWDDNVEADLYLAAFILSLYGVENAGPKGFPGLLVPSNSIANIALEGPPMK